jgi:acetate kinase
VLEQILVADASRSSIKFEIFDVGAADEKLTRRLRARIDGIGGTRPRFIAEDLTGTTAIQETYSPRAVRDLSEAIGAVRDRLRDYFSGAVPSAVGHRVLHGGPAYSAPVLVDEAVIVELERLIPFAPLHQPSTLAPIKIIHAASPNIPQVACFDTSFHCGHPDLADHYAIPEELYVAGVRRYGFHGLSYEYIVSRLPDVAPDIASKRIVIAHLGSESSMCAVVAGRSVESSMGFTALDGIPMGSRPGQIDPGLVLYLLNHKGMKVSEIERFLYSECGLKGLSGVSSEVRDLYGSCGERPKFALEFFTYRIALMAASLVAAMGGIDGFIFTAGIGETEPLIRDAVMRRLAWLGLEIDPHENAKGGPRISKIGARIPCFVIPTDEGLMVARHTLAKLRDPERR